MQICNRVNICHFTKKYLSVLLSTVEMKIALYLCILIDIIFCRRGN